MGHELSMRVSSTGLHQNLEIFEHVEKAARRFVSVEMLSHCCMNNANRSRVSLRSTFSNCHFYAVTRIVCTRIVVL